MINIPCFGRLPLSTDTTVLPLARVSRNPFTGASVEGACGQGAILIARLARECRTQSAALTTGDSRIYQLHAQALRYEKLLRQYATALQDPRPSRIVSIVEGWL